MDHGQAGGLKHDTGELNEETNEHKVNLTNRGNNDTNDNGGDVEELLQVGLRDAEGPARDQDCDGSSGLEHLDKGNGQVKVCQVTANQTEGEEDTNGDDGAQVHAASHFDRLTAIKNGGPSGKALGDDSRKRKVVGREDNGVVCESSVSIPWSRIEAWKASRAGGDVRNLRVSSTHLLKRMTEELKPIQTLRRWLAEWLVRHLVSCAMSLLRMKWDVHDVESRRNAVSCRSLRLLSRRVDGRQNW